LVRPNPAWRFRQGQLRCQVAVTDKPTGGDIMMETGRENA
jgi:hypothetical protein